jgi:hypothetical protein
MINQEFNIRLLRSVDHPDIARLYAREQADVLRNFGVTGIASANQPWQSDPNTFMFIAEDAATGAMVAGMRLDRESGRKPIPMLEALVKMSPEFKDVVENLKPLGLAEGCGWWVKDGFAGLGLPGVLLRAGVSVAPRLGISYIFGFPHQHTKKIMSKFGFIAIDVVGENGSFMYPDDRYKSTVVELNTRTLHTVPRLERGRMLSLRSNPECSVNEGGVTLSYFLKLSRNPILYFKRKNYRSMLKKASTYILLGRTVTRPALQGVRMLLSR